MLCLLLYYENNAIVVRLRYVNGKVFVEIVLLYKLFENLFFSSDLDMCV